MRRLYRENKLLYSCYIAVLTCVSSLALGLELGEVKLSKKADATGYYAWIETFRGSFNFDKTNNLFILVLIGIMLFLLVRNEYSRRSKGCSLFFSLGSSSLLLIGRAFYKENNLDKIFKSVFTMEKAMLILVGYTILIYFIINAVMERLIPKVVHSATLKSYLPKRFKITIWSCFAAIILAWLPYMILCYPCNFTADSRDEIAQFLGDEEVCKTNKTICYPEESTTLLNNHHPIVYTLLVGSFAKMGLAAGNINIAMFLLVILQMAALAWIYSYTVNYIKSLDVPILLQMMALGFFMFYPLVPIYGMTVTKDSLYGACILLVTIQLLKMLTNKRLFFASRREGILTFCSVLGLMLLRNNGLYISIFIFFVLVVIHHKERSNSKKILFCIGIPILLYGGVLLKVILPLCHIPGGSPREMLSVPFQQVARYAVEWGEDGFREDEIKKLDRILCFDGDLEVLKGRYDPVLSDPVKSKFNKYYTKEELKDFMRVWLKLLERHPGTCVMATLNNVYYYFSVDYGKPVIYIGAGSNGAIYGIKNASTTEGARLLLLRTITALKDSSMLGWAFSVGTWSYLFLFAILYIIYQKQYRYLLMILPVIINVIIAIAGPVAYMRYAIQWIVVLPLYGVVIWLCCKESDQTVKSIHVR
ncbi:MAG: DUF6020 family protein [bacterium]|nr:DUF6020 family protein [bacterium]